ncbi:hypothetical protein OY671_011829, partial [Metschnikowia pulcherrima]
GILPETGALGTASPARQWLDPRSWSISTQERCGLRGFLHTVAVSSHRVGRHETAGDDAAAVMHVPHDGMTDWVAAIPDDGPLGYGHPSALNGNPIG